MKLILPLSRLDALWFFWRVQTVLKVNRRQAYWLAVAKYGFENLKQWALVRKVKPENWQLIEG